MIEPQHFSPAPGGLMESIAMSEEYGGEIKIVTLQQFFCENFGNNSIQS